MPPAEGADPTAESVNLANIEGVQAYFASDHATPESLATFIRRLRHASVCRWCLAPLKRAPEAPATCEDAGEAEWLPETVIKGTRRAETFRLYCDRDACAKAGLLDDPAPRECRDRGQLHQHFDNLLAALREFYAVDDVAPDAGHAALEDALADRENGGQDIEVLAAGLAAAL
jgi:hypothetical protein